VVTWNFAAVWDGIAREVPDREALVCGARRVTWGEFSTRAHRLAAHLQSLGLGAGDKVAIDLPNCPEYLETFFGALVLGAVPVNVNYRYTPDEVHHVVDDSDAKVVVHSADVTGVVRKACKRIQKRWRPATIEIGAPYEAALAAAAPTPDPGHVPSGDDLVFIYTGGTTGMPKGVMWRNEDLYVGLWVQAHPKDPEPPDPIAAARAGKRAGTRLPVSPLMHGTGLMTTLATMAGGGTIVLIDHKGLDVELVWDTVEREQVRSITIVGDVFARPLLDALVLHSGRWDLSCLRSITSSGVLFSPDVKHALLRELPGLTIVDTLGASEGLGPSNASTSGDPAIAPARFRVSDRVSVIDEVTGHPVAPGSDEVGLVAMGGNIPIGYYNDPAKTAATFRVIGGKRYSVPGDYATVAADGTVQLRGRGSACINTGGEKVYPEEVELTLKKHASVFDCAVVGVPDPRFGEKVVGIVQVTENHYLDAAELTAWSRRKLAGYKMPREWLFVDVLPRSAAGKVDHPKLRALAMQRLGIEP
jgi:acyl-CoA synthetase (AMP-forming)/AMP-acid ligase II